MKRFIKYIAGILGVALVTTTTLAVMSSGILKAGLLIDAPLNSGWNQSATVLSDRGATHNNLTANGSPTIGADDVTFSTGTSDYLEFDSAVDVDVSATVSFDFKVTNVTTTQVLCYLSSGADYVVIGIYQSKLLASAINTTAGSKVSATTLQNDTWYNVTVTKIAGGAITIDNIYLNGDDDTAASAVFLSGADPGYIIGGSYAGGSYGTGMNGNIKNFKTWIGVLSTDAIKLLSDKSDRGTITSGSLSKGLVYDSTLTDKWIDSSGDVLDKSANHNVGIVTGATVGPNSTTFNGAGDQINVTSSSWPSSQISISMWVTVSNSLLNLEVLAAKWDAVASKGTFAIFADDDGKIYFRTMKSGDLSNSRLITTTSAQMVADTEYHITCTYDGTNGIGGYAVYINGTSVPIVSVGVTGTPDGLHDNDADITFGDLASGGGVNDLDGIMSNIKLWDSVLTSDEAQLEFDKGKNSTITSGSLSKGLIFDAPSTTEWAQSSTVLSDKSAYHNHSSTINGNPTIGANFTSYDGDDDLGFGTDSSLDFTGDYSVIVRMNSTNTTGSTQIFVSRYNDGINQGFVLRKGVARTVEIYHLVAGANYNNIVGSINIDDGADHLIILTFEVGVGSEIFVDNVSDGTDNTTTAAFTAWVPELMFGGQNAGQTRRYTGDLWDVELYNKALTADERTLIFESQ